MVYLGRPRSRGRGRSASSRAPSTPKKMCHDATDRHLPGLKMDLAHMHTCQVTRLNVHVHCVYIPYLPEYRSHWYIWRARASQPSRTTGAIFLYVYIYIYMVGRCTYPKCFYVNFFNRNHRVQRSTSYYLRAACTYRNVLRISKSANLCTEPREICVLMASPTQTHRADEEEFTDMASLSPTKVAKVQG